MLNEVDSEHRFSFEEYTKLYGLSLDSHLYSLVILFCWRLHYSLLYLTSYDAVATGMQKVLPSLNFVGLALSSERDLLVSLLQSYYAVFVLAKTSCVRYSPWLRSWGSVVCSHLAFSPLVVSVFSGSAQPRPQRPHARVHQFPLLRFVVKPHQCEHVSCPAFRRFSEILSRDVVVTATFSWFCLPVVAWFFVCFPLSIFLCRQLAIV
jgi:hypothetical protein